MLVVANIWGFIVAHRFTILRVVVLIALLGAVLFTMDYCTGFWSERGIKKHKANVNKALEAVNAEKSNLVNQKVDEAIAVERVREATKEAIEASQASEAAKAEATVALQRYEAARKANAPTGVTEQQLRDALDKLEE